MSSTCSRSCFRDPPRSTPSPSSPTSTPTSPPCRRRWPASTSSASEAIYCGGDLVGYGGPHPNEVCALIAERGIPTIYGNYDYAIARDFDDCGCAYITPEDRALGQRSVAWTLEHTDQPAKDFMRELPFDVHFTVGETPLHLVHGSPRKVNEYLFEDKPASLYERLAGAESDQALVFGHTTSRGYTHTAACCSSTADRSASPRTAIPAARSPSCGPAHRASRSRSSASPSPARAASARPRSPAPSPSPWPTRAGACCWSAPTRRPTSTRCSACALAPSRPPVPGVAGLDVDEHRPRGGGRDLSRAGGRPLPGRPARRGDRQHGGAALGRLHRRDRGLRRVHRAARRPRADRGLRPRRLRHRPDRPHAAAADAADRLERVRRRASGRHHLPRPARRPGASARAVRRPRCAPSPTATPRPWCWSRAPSTPRSARLLAPAPSSPSSASRNQQLVVNGVFRRRTRATTRRRWRYAARQQRPWRQAPRPCAEMPGRGVPLAPGESTGIGRDPDADRGWPPADATGRRACAAASGCRPWATSSTSSTPRGHGVILTMGKGGVGKTTIAAALAVALADRGHASPLDHRPGGARRRTRRRRRGRTLTVERIDPAAETERYTRGGARRRRADLDAQGRALLEEDLRSPCTEEIAVFRAFARTR